jgi:hypothetical protein
MIKGEKIRDYNEFEQGILSIAGNVHDCLGLAFFYEHINQTFDIAERAVLMNSEDYKGWFESEDFETQRSIFLYDMGHQINTIPLTELLRNAHFITIHSEFESNWKEISLIHNQFLPERKFAKLSYKFLSDENYNPSCILDKVVNQNKILISYNYLRNKIVHQNAPTNCPEYKELKKYVDLGEIEHLKIIETDDKASFVIESNKFNRKYTERIIKFIIEIADSSFNSRQVTV